MAITKFDPHTIYLGGPRTEINDLAASEIITPGMLVETVDSGGALKVQKHATAAGAGHRFATEASMLNNGIDVDYAAGDLVETSEGGPGTSFLAIIASGANIARGAKLESAGNGKVRAWTASPTPLKALEAKDNSAGPGDARIRVEFM